MKRLLLLLLFTLFIQFSKAQIPVWLWAESSTGFNYEYGCGVIADTSGNIFVGGRLGGTANFGGKTVTGTGANNPIIGKFDSSGKAIWLDINNYSGGFDYMWSICRDQNNNVYGTGTVNSGSSTFVEKYNNAGTLRWDPTPGSGGAEGIAADNSDNVYIVGQFSGSATFGSVTVTDAGSGGSVYLVKLDSSGNFLWGKTINGNGSVTSVDVVTDNSGNLYIIGQYNGTYTFDTITSPASTGISNFYIAKYDTAGNIQWITTASDAGEWGPQWEPHAIQIDPCGNIYVTGMFEGLAQFGTFSVNSVGDEDMFVAKVLSNGKWEWVNTAGGPGQDHGFSLALDKYYDVYVAGDYGENTGTGINFGNGISYTGTGTFVAKYDNGTGQLIWGQVGGVAATDHVYGMDVDKWGYTYITGDFSNTTTYGTTNLTCTGASNILIAKLDTVPSSEIYPIIITSSYCPGSTITLPYNVRGNFNGGNTFIVQLSDSTGSFVNAVNLDTIASTTGGIVNVTIPLNTPSGSNYMIRLVSSNPAISSYSGCPGFTIGNSLNVSVTPPDTLTCAGGSVQLSASGGTKYLWSNGDTLSSITVNPATDTTYYVTVTNGTCSGTDSSVVIVTPAPPFVILPLDTAFCSSQSAILYVSGGGSNFIWTPTSGITDSTLSGDSVTVSPTATTTYMVTGIYPGGCAASGTDMVTVIPSPGTPTFTQNGDTLISSSVHDNQWYRNDSLLTDDTSQYLITHTPGEYYVIVTNEANGCSTASDSMQIKTGINQLSVIGSQLSIYPNPFNNSIFIKINFPAEDMKDWNVEVTDVLGRTLFAISSLNYNNKIDLSNLSSGVYFITIMNKTGQAVFPIVKSNN